MHELENRNDLYEGNVCVCSNHRLLCSCGQNYANILFKNHVLRPVVINNLYCPECSANVQVDFECMLVDNGWILEFNLALACGFLQCSNISTTKISPAFIFDNGYASWNGITPNELEQRLTERQEIIALAHQDMRQYLAEIRRWGCERVKKFREAGWRKAQYC